MDDHIAPLGLEGTRTGQLHTVPLCIPTDRCSFHLVVCGKDLYQRERGRGSRQINAP